ncbi:GntR family transcriptional regulator [Streptomyces sp. NPDC057638]|uniref:GntR family transcriptional regulator n=1 Tax=Streptomyces sp. NPDC057638 TaxID=3346190 RepID=UPI0036884924
MITIASHRYASIADDLRRQIAMDLYKAGDQLPAETELMSVYGSSRPTVREALAVLENEGLVVRLQGRGSFVRQNTQMIYAANALAATAHGWTTGDVKVSVHRKTVKADDRLAALLRVAPGTSLSEHVYLPQDAALPCGLARVYVPHAIADIDTLVGSALPLGDDVRQRLAELGVTVTKVVSRASARLPNDEEARTLRVGTGTAVLDVERMSMDASGRVVEAALLVLPGHSSWAVFTARSAHREREVAG